VLAFSLILTLSLTSCKDGGGGNNNNNNNNNNSSSRTFTLEVVNNNSKTITGVRVNRAGPDGNAEEYVNKTGLSIGTGQSQTFTFTINTSDSDGKGCNVTFNLNDNSQAYEDAMFFPCKTTTFTLENDGRVFVEN
jgi:hypothetical protein